MTSIAPDYVYNKTLTIISVEGLVSFAVIHGPPTMTIGRNRGGRRDDTRKRHRHHLGARPSIRDAIDDGATDKMAEAQDLKSN